MAKIGYKSYLGYAAEASFGTYVAPTNYLEFNSESFKKEKAEILVDAINGTPQFNKRVVGGTTINFSFEFPVIPGAIEKFLNQAIGTVTSTAISTGASYSHVYLGRADRINTKSLSFQVCRDTDDTTSVYNYTGCKVNSLNFNMDAGGTLKGTIEGIGLEESSANTISTASYRTSNPFVFNNATIKFGNSISVATTTNLVSAVTINVANNLVTDQVLGTVGVGVIHGGMQDVTWEATARFDDSTLYNRFINNTPSFVSAQFVSDSITATHSHTILLESYNCYFNGTTPNIGSPTDLIKATYPIRAIYEAASSSSIKITVTSDLTAGT